METKLEILADKLRRAFPMAIVWIDNVYDDRPDYIDFMSSEKLYGISCSTPSSFGLLAVSDESSIVGLYQHEDEIVSELQKALL